MPPPPFIRSIELRNYKSLAQCSVPLGPLTFFVGPNSAGKSNFLDALKFVRDSLVGSLDHALRDRGGIHEVRRRSRGHPTHFSISLEFVLPDEATGTYEFTIASRPGGAYAVHKEQCTVHRPGSEPSIAFFTVREGRARGSSPVLPPATEDRLFLVAAAGLPEFAPVYESLTQMGFYNFNPAAVRALQPPQSSGILRGDGSNISSVMRALANTGTDTKERVEKYLSAVVPGVVGVDAVVVGRMETLEFKQLVKGSEHPWRFPAESMSDGTLRALCVLVALFQPATEPWERAPLVAIEEPELALHPAASAVVLDALAEASRTTQVLVTSHSPELLDDPSIGPDSILTVLSNNGNTEIGPVQEAARSAMRERLYTAGELLRLNQLSPDPAPSD